LDRFFGGDRGAHVPVGLALALPGLHRGNEVGLFGLQLDAYFTQLDLNRLHQGDELRGTRKGEKPHLRLKPLAQFIADCSSSKWSKHMTNSPFLALRATAGSNAAYKIISACSNAVS